MSSLSDVLQSKKCLIPYLTFADPSPDASEQIMRAALDAGADVLEIGLPFSDPIADGPVIQESHQRALQHKPNISKALELVSRLRRDYSQPLVFMGSVNLILHYGIDAFFADASTAGLSAIIMPDLSVEEAPEYINASKTHALPIIFLVSPLCRDHRLSKIVEAADGFIYLISSTGTTGVRDTITRDLSALVHRIKSLKDIPVAVGFGISTPSHVRDVHSYADAAIVGSHLVKIIPEFSDDIPILCAKIADEIHKLHS